MLWILNRSCFAKGFKPSQLSSSLLLNSNASFLMARALGHAQRWGPFPSLCYPRSVMSRRAVWLVATQAMFNVRILKVSPQHILPCRSLLQWVHPDTQLGLGLCKNKHFATPFHIVLPTSWATAAECFRSLERPTFPAGWSQEIGNGCIFCLHKEPWGLWQPIPWLPLATLQFNICLVLKASRKWVNSPWCSRAFIHNT